MLSQQWSTLGPASSLNGHRCKDSIVMVSYIVITVLQIKESLSIEWAIIVPIDRDVNILDDRMEASKAYMHMLVSLFDKGAMTGQ